MDNEILKRCVKELGNNLAANSKGNCLLIATDDQVTEMVLVVIKAMREPTGKMLALGPEVQCWPEVIDFIIGDK